MILKTVPLLKKIISPLTCIRENRPTIIGSDRELTKYFLFLLPVTLRIKMQGRIVVNATNHLDNGLVTTSKTGGVCSVCDACHELCKHANFSR